MVQGIRKTFDLGIAATAAIIILNFAANSFGLGTAEAQDTEETVPTFQMASLSN